MVWLINEKKKKNKQDEAKINTVKIYGAQTLYCNVKQSTQLENVAISYNSNYNRNQCWIKIFVCFLIYKSHSSVNVITESVSVQLCDLTQKIKAW